MKLLWLLIQAMFCLVACASIISSTHAAERKITFVTIYRARPKAATTRVARPRPSPTQMHGMCWAPGMHCGIVVAGNHIEPTKTFEAFKRTIHPTNKPWGFAQADEPNSYGGSETQSPHKAVMTSNIESVPSPSDRPLNATALLPMVLTSSAREPSDILH